MGTCCYYYKFNNAIPERKAYHIQLALEDMVEVHSEELPSPHPVKLPIGIRLCMCNNQECICPINYTELVRHILFTIQHRMYSIKGSTGFHHSSRKLSYLLYLAQE